MSLEGLSHRYHFFSENKVGYNGEVICYSDMAISI